MEKGPQESLTPQPRSVRDVPRTGWELAGKLLAFPVPAFVHLHQVTDTCLIVRIKGGAVCVVLYYHY